MGRKRSHRDETRTKIISARLTHDTYELVSEHAERLGLTRASYVEHLIETKPLRIVRGQMDELTVPLINELKRIGNNLNQIAHARNAGADIDPSHFHTVLAEIIRVICRNEMTRKHYAEAYTEVVGHNRDDDAVDPAMRGMPPLVRQGIERAGAPLGEASAPTGAVPLDVSNDNPPPQRPAAGRQTPFAVPPELTTPPIADPPNRGMTKRVTPLQAASPPRTPWSTTPRHISPVHRHDPSPQSAWTKFLRRLHLRSS